MLDLPGFWVDVLKLDLMASNWSSFAVKDEKPGGSGSTIYTPNVPVGLLLLVRLGDTFWEVLMALDRRRRIDVLDMLYFGLWLRKLQGIGAGNGDCSNWHRIHGVSLQ
jgi:hypothetical protein